MSKTIITFAKNWRGYAAGETAGFSETIAAALIESGHAEEAGKKSRKPSKPAGRPTPDPKPDTPPAADPNDDEKP